MRVRERGAERVCVRERGGGRMRESAKEGAWVDDRDILVCKRERECERDDESAREKGRDRVCERKGEGG